MKDLRFCQYNVEYQQRLGFLKVLVSLLADDRSPPNKSRLLDRMRFLFKPWNTSTAAAYLRADQQNYGPLDIPSSRKEVLKSKPRLITPIEGTKPTPTLGDVLVRHRSLPSWQLGFFEDRLDRLFVWAHWMGLIGAEGQITEWGLTLKRNIRQEVREAVTSGTGVPNPFELTSDERAIFLQLLLFADHPSITLITRLAQLPTNRLLSSRKASLVTFVALADVLRIQRSFASVGANILAVRDLAEVVGQIATEFAIEVPKTAHDCDELMGVIHNQKGLSARKRSRLAENHAIPRFEQMADLALVEKEDPENPPRDTLSRLEQRTMWSYRPSNGLHAAAETLTGAIAQLQPRDWPTGAARVWDVMGGHWIGLVEAASGRPLRRLELVRDRMLMGEMLDRGYERAARSYGFTQFHTVALEASLAALRAGYRLEMQDCLEFALTVQRTPALNEHFRLTGDPTLARLVCSFSKRFVDALRSNAKL